MITPYTTANKQTNHHHHYQHPKTNIDTPVIFQNIWDSLSSSWLLFVTENEKKQRTQTLAKKLNQANKNILQRTNKDQ